MEGATEEFPLDPWNIWPGIQNNIGLGIGPHWPTTSVGNLNSKFPNSEAYVKRNGD